MEGVRDFCLDQPRDEIENLKCMHSKAAEYLTGSTENYWDIPHPSNEDKSNKIMMNNDIFVQSLIDQGGNLFLGTYQTQGLISVLYTVSTKQKVPMCSLCASKKCKCFNKYKAVIEETYNENGQDVPAFHWERRNAETQVPPDNCHEPIELNEQYKQHGYNITPFEYPIKRDPEFQAKFIERSNGQYNLPPTLEAEYNPNLVCQHGWHFNSSNDVLVQTSTNLIIYTQTNDIVLNTKTFARPTIGPCKCLQQFDGHPVLLWNLGRGKMVDYPFLHSVIHQGITGSPIFSIFHSRSTYFSSLGIQSTLSIQDFERTCSGYASMIRFRKEDFMCSNCGHTPKYIVADGKMSGPTKKKVYFFLQFLSCLTSNRIIIIIINPKRFIFYKIIQHKNK